MSETVSTLLKADKNVLFAYMFGSCVDGSADERSDVDIAVYLQDISLDQRLSLLHRLQKALHKKVDLVVLNEVKNIYLLEAILYHGKLLKDHPDRQEWELYKEHEIKDFKAFRKAIDAA